MKSIQHFVIYCSLGLAGLGQAANPTPSRVITTAVKGSLVIGSPTPAVPIVGGAEIPAFDPVSKRAFTTSGRGIEVVDLANLAAPIFLQTIAPASLGAATITSNDVSSVAVFKGTTTSIVAAAVINVPKTNNGHVVFLDAATGALLGFAEVGCNPDHVCFTPDGSKVLVANEGELDGASATVPDLARGTVSIVDISNLAVPVVATADFTSFDSAAATLRAAGVRLFTGGLPSTDFEPEYIAISPDGTKAMVTIQEANAVAVLDIATATFTSVKALGKKSYAAGSYDFSDRDGPGATALNKTTTGNPVFGLYMPDGIAAYSSGGNDYYVIANEGDDRDDFITPDETIRVGNAAYVLDPTVFPNAAALKADAVLGRLTVSNSVGLRGDTDSDGDIDEILALGGRSFSILDASGNMVFDSGDMIEQIISKQHPSRFDDTRSDNKGAEPEGVTIAVLDGRTYAFIGLERSNMELIFDVTDPLAVSYVSTADRVGDVSPEGMVVISAANSPSRRPFLLVANEVSQTLSVHEISQPYTSANLDVIEPNTTAWPGTGVVLGGTRFINLGLQGVGRIPASAIDPATGESIGSISDMQVANWKKNSDGSYSGDFHFLPDRGYNSGVIYSNYAARINEFQFSFKPYTAAAATLAQDQIRMRFSRSRRFVYDHDANAGTPAIYSTGLLAGSTATLFGGVVPAAAVSTTQSDGTFANRLTLDAEGLVLDSRSGKTGSGWVSDEYGPFVYRFDGSGQIVGSLQLPQAIVPHSPVGTTSFSTSPVNLNGRRENQGMEGIAQSPDGTRLFALLQSATLQDSGSGNQGRYNTRLLVYDISATDMPADPISQYVVQLPRVDSTGLATNGVTVDRTAAQSTIVALNNHQLLILSRDGNGRGAAGAPVFKSILLAELSSGTNIDGTYDAEAAQVAPAGLLNLAVTPVSWTEALNLLGKLDASGPELAKFNLNLNTAPGDSNTVSEKWEGLSLVSANDSANPNDYFLFVGNDNDFASRSGVYRDAAGVLQSYDSGLENDSVLLAYRVRILGPDNQAPFAAGVLPELSTPKGSGFSFVVPASTFADPESQVLSYSATLADGSALPAWLSWNATSRTLSGTPADADEGTLKIRITATDGSGLSASTTFGLRIATAQELVASVLPVSRTQVAMSVSLPKAKTTFLALPLAHIAAEGTVVSLDGSDRYTLSIPLPEMAGASYALKIISRVDQRGAGASAPAGTSRNAYGFTGKITAGSGRQVTAVLAVAPNVGDKFIIYRLRTLGEVFTGAALNYGATPAAADVVYLSEGGSFIGYYKYDVAAWRAVSGGTAELSGLVIDPGSALLVVRLNAGVDTSASFLGSPIPGREAGSASGFKLVNNPFAIATTLEASGLQETIAGGSGPGAADIVYLENGGVITGYYYKSRGLGEKGWRILGDNITNRGAALVRPGRALLIREQAGSASFHLPEPFAE